MGRGGGRITPGRWSAISGRGGEWRGGRTDFLRFVGGEWRGSEGRNLRMAGKGVGRLSLTGLVGGKTDRSGNLDRGRLTDLGRNSRQWRLAGGVGSCGEMKGKNKKPGKAWGCR